MRYKKEFVDFVYLVALQGLNYIAPLVVFPYLMKVLGAEKFGYIGLSLSVNQYLMLLVDFGFNLSATKKIAQAKNDSVELNKIFYATLWAKVGLLIISLILLLIMAFTIPQFKIYSSTMMIMFIMVFANTFSFIWLFQGLGKIRIVSIINTISKLLILPLTFIFVKSAEDYNLAALIQSFTYVLSSIFTIIFLIKNKYITGWFISTKDRIKTELKSAYPIFLSIAATSIYTASFPIILGLFSSPVEVGKYTAAEKIMRSLCYFVFIPISQSFFPKVSELSLKSKKEAISLVKKLLYLMVGIMIILFILLYFFSTPLTHFLGKDYGNTDVLLKIMAVIPLMIASGGILGQFGILAIGNEEDKKKFQKVYFIAGISSIFFVLILTPLYSAMGVSIALLLTESLVASLMFFHWKAVKDRELG
jgi:O-antigen/teichoic acid export membrane protein